MSQSLKDASVRISPGSVGSRLARLALVAVTLTAGVLLATPQIVWLSQHVLDGQSDTLDLSWMLDLPTRLRSGELAGRDFAFTYGPAYQILHALGLLIPHHDVASVLRFHAAPECWLVAVGVWLVLGRTGAPLRWRIPLYIFWLCVWPPTAVVAMNSLIRASTDIAGVKPLGPLLISCLAGDSLIARGPESRSGRMYRRVTWAVGVPLSYAYSIDLGLVLLAALLCQVTLVLIWPRKIRAGLRGRAFDSLVAMALGVFVAFGAWSIDARGRWGLVSGWTMAMGFGESMAWGFPGAPPWPLILLGSALCCGLGAVTAVNLGIAHKCESTSALHQPWGVLLGACAFAGPWVRYGWTLSDGAHLLRAVIPAIFILCCLVPAAFAAKSRPIWALVSLVGWLAVGPLSPSWVSIPASIQARAESIRAIDLTPAHILIDRDDLTEGSLLLSDSPAAAAFVWPQGVLVATLAGKRNACPTVQTYAALGDSLTDTLVDQLAANPTTPVLVNPRDSTLVGIEHTGRNSRVLENLLANYEIDQAAGDLFLRLRRRERPADWTRGPIEFSPDGTAWQPRQWPAADSRLEIPLDPGHDLRASDLLAVKLRLIDAPRGLLDKPGRVVVRFELDRSGLRHQSFFVPRDGQVHDYLISACTIRDPLWLTLFHPTRVWRSKDRLTSLTFGWEGLDAWSPPPAEVEIKSLEVLRRDGLEIREGPIADQGNPELRDWFFGNFSRTDQP